MTDLEAQYRAAVAQAKIEIDNKIAEANNALVQATMAADAAGVPFCAHLESGTVKYMPSSFRTKLLELKEEGVDTGELTDDLGLYGYYGYTGWSTSSMDC